MNKTLALSAFVMFAVIMGMSAIAPAMAAPGGEKGANPEAPGQTGEKDPCENSKRGGQAAPEEGNNAGGNGGDARDKKCVDEGGD